MAPAAKQRAAQTVPVADKEAPVRQLVKTMPADEGYEVLEAAAGDGGRTIFDRRKNHCQPAGSPAESFWWWTTKKPLEG